MTRRLRYSLALFVLAAVLLPASAAAAPSDTTETLDRHDPEKVKLLRLLNSNSISDQQRAVRLISHYAHTGRYEADFFDLLVAPLHGLVRSGKTTAVRIMSISALGSIGTDAAMWGLQTQIDRLESPRVQRIARNALAAHKARRVATSTR
mgnify:CR=1 FL=1